MARASFTDPAISQEEETKTKGRPPKSRGVVAEPEEPETQKRGSTRGDSSGQEQTQEETRTKPGVKSGSELATQKPNTQMARQEGYLDDGDFEGELDGNDLLVPFLTLVHATSEIAEDFDPGAFVLGKEVQLGPKGSSFDIIVVRAAKRFKEYLSQDNPNEPRVFLTAQEVVENGGQISNYGDDIAYFAGLGEFLFLIKKPANLGPEYDLAFPYEIEGNNYALGRYSAFRSAYTGVAKHIFNLKLYGKPIKATAWKLSSVFTRKGDKTYWVPKVVQMPNSNVSASVLEFIETIPD